MILQCGVVVFIAAYYQNHSLSTATCIHEITNTGYYLKHACRISYWIYCIVLRACVIHLYGLLTNRPIDHNNWLLPRLYVSGRLPCGIVRLGKYCTQFCKSIISLVIQNGNKCFQWITHTFSCIEHCWKLPLWFKKHVLSYSFKRVVFMW